MSYLYHLNRHNVGLYKLCSYCQHLETLYMFRRDYKNSVLWERLDKHVKCFKEAYDEEFTLVGEINEVLSKAEFNDFRASGRYLSNVDCVPENIVDVYARVTCYDLSGWCKELLDSDRKYFKSDKALIRMLERAVEKVIHVNTGDWEWYFFEVIIPILTKLYQKHYRRDDYYYF